MFKNLNLPNKLTILRIILVPVFVALMAISSIESLEWFAFIALGVYVIASITDFIDGKIARSKNLVTDFGKVMDPLADKILVAAGFIMLTYLKVVPGWITAIIICRDFFVDSLRVMALMKNVVVPASLSGKIKTFFQMVTIILAIASVPVAAEYSVFLSFVQNGFSMSIIALLINVFMSVCLVGTIIATIWSLVEYIIKFNKILTDSNVENADNDEEEDDKKEDDEEDDDEEDDDDKKEDDEEDDDEDDDDDKDDNQIDEEDKDN